MSWLGMIDIPSWYGFDVQEILLVTSDEVDIPLSSVTFLSGDDHGHGLPIRPVQLYNECLTGTLALEGIGIFYLINFTIQVGTCLYSP